MKYDKYGDPIVEVSEKLDSKKQRAIYIMIALLTVLVLVNLIGMFINGGVYLAFLTAPLYIFFYIAYLKGCSAIKEISILPGYCKVVSILSPILYLITAMLAVFGGM